MPKTDQLFEEFYKVRNSENYFFNKTKIKKQVLYYKKNFKQDKRIMSSLIVEKFYESFLVCLKVSCLYILEKYQKHYESKLTSNDFIEMLEINFQEIEAMENTKQLYLFDELLVESIDSLKKYYRQIQKEISKNKSDKIIKEIDGTKMQERLNLLISEFKLFYNQIKKYSEFIDDPEFKNSSK